MKIKAISIKGNREINQDSIMINDSIFCQTSFMRFETEFDNERLLMIVIADGMGGEHGGEKASRMVVETLCSDMSSGFQSTDINNCDELILNAIAKAQEKIQKDFSVMRIAGGTTVSVLLMHNGKFISYNIGDSPIYLIRKKEFTLISEKHTLAQFKKSNGVPEADICEEDEHCLMQCVGSGGYSTIARFEGEYVDGDQFVVMSDGLELLGKRKMEKMILKNSFNTKKLQFLDDNISVITVRV